MQSFMVDPNDDKTRPKFMRQARLDPCKCNRCYFCKKKTTTGVIHKPMSMRSPHKRNRTHYCSGKQANLKKDPFTAECTSYTKKKRLDPEASAEAIKKRCNKSTMGCKQCDLRICKYCWPQFEELDHQLPRSS